MTSRFVPFAVTVCGIEELSGHGAAGVTHVLSILDPGEPEPAAFGAFGEHERLELRFHDIIEDLPAEVPPDAGHVAAILGFGRDLMAEPGGCGHLLVHCHMGISRSTAALTMLLAQARPDRPADEAVAAVAAIRDKTWPNLRMIEYADAALGRKGALIDAVRRRHRAVGLARPDIVTYMRENHRAREVDWFAP
ncbi:putative protein tyrosine phosphatase [Azospirillum fermentarium]|uniref:tyrosine phosphatase family protein n=1 Tax=Azospirillum fermentarium TaxID=1233114 RepID=UPI002226B8B7|nr:protein-tyrosine-phosphatase [Azospirillum fermentarium]MCW2248721.1 putative protein tyrosine phosphatase [Azospirillum fermentarium]